MAVSLTQAQAYFDKFEVAYLAVISGSSYTISAGGNNRTFTRQDIKTLRSEMQYWSTYINKLNSGNKGLPIKFGTPYGV